MNLNEIALSDCVKKEGIPMQTTQSRYYRVEEVMAMLEISKTKAYEVIRQLNKELEDMGKITVRGKINKTYFDEKTL